MAEAIRIGTLGAAAITPAALIAPAAENPEVEVVAIAARDPVRARAFAAQHGLTNVHDSYDALIDDPTLDAIYNPLPISLHREYTIKGRELVHVEGRFLVPSPAAGDIRMHYATGGGATMDMGCYPISWLRHISGEEPEVTAARARLGNPDVDLRLEAEYRLAGGATATTVGSMCESSFAADLVSAHGCRGRRQADASHRCRLPRGRAARPLTSSSATALRRRTGP